MNCPSMPGTWWVLIKTHFLPLPLFLCFFSLRCREGREGRGRLTYSAEKSLMWMDVVFGLKRQNLGQAVTVGEVGRAGREHPGRVSH